MNLLGYLVLVACLVALWFGFALWSKKLSLAFRQAPLSGDDPHELSVVSAEISLDELERFRNADMVSFAVRETNHLDTRFFWVHDFDHGRLYARALFIALGITPAQLVEVFGVTPETERSGVVLWDDLGAIPLKLSDTGSRDFRGAGTYNIEPFRRLATLLGKDLDIRLEPKPLAGVKQGTTHLFIAHQVKEIVEVVEFVSA